jgi:sugar lactone lactonase YvrE
MPDGLLWQPDGVYFADAGAGLFQKLVPGGVQRLHFPNSDILSPEDVATNGQGDFYFTDGETGSVWHWNGSLGIRLLAGREQGLRRTEGIAVAPSGDIYVGDGEVHSIFKIASTGFTQVYATGITKPEALAFDPDGGLYVGDNAEGKLYYLSHGQSQLVLHDQQLVPETIAWHGRGLLIADSVHGRLYRWVPGSIPEVIAAFGGDLRRLAGVTADDHGNIWVSVQTSVKAKKGYVFKLTRANHATSR